MSDIKEVINNLEGLISLKAASDEAIENAENELALQLSDEYKDYLKEYGAVLAIGVELTGIAKSKHRDVVQVTKKEWAANSKISNNLYVVENVAIDGIVIWQDADGKIYESTPNNEAKFIYNNLAEYLKNK